MKRNILKQKLHSDMKTTFWNKNASETKTRSSEWKRHSIRCNEAVYWADFKYSWSTVATSGSKKAGRLMTVVFGLLSCILNSYVHIIVQYVLPFLWTFGKYCRHFLQSLRLPSPVGVGRYVCLIHHVTNKNMGRGKLRVCEVVKCEVWCEVARDWSLAVGSPRTLPSDN